MSKEVVILKDWEFSFPPKAYHGDKYLLKTWIEINSCIGNPRLSWSRKDYNNTGEYFCPEEFSVAGIAQSGPLANGQRMVTSTVMGFRRSGGGIEITTRNSKYFLPDNEEDSSQKEFRTAIDCALTVDGHKAVKDAIVEFFKNK